jgi:hypothetical protein
LLSSYTVRFPHDLSNDFISHPPARRGALRSLASMKERKSEKLMD